MKCINCGVSVMKEMLHRTGPMGQDKMDPMCIHCIRILHPELAANIEEDFKEEPILGTLNDIFYGSKEP